MRFGDRVAVDPALGIDALGAVVRQYCQEHQLPSCHVVHASGAVLGRYYAKAYEVYILGDRCDCDGYILRGLRPMATLIR